VNGNNLLIFDFEVYCIIKRLYAASTAHNQTCYYALALEQTFLLNKQSNMLQS